MFGLGSSELILVLVVAAIFFGGKKIPELMKGIGSGIKEFKKASSSDEDEKPKINDSN